MQKILRGMDLLNHAMVKITKLIVSACIAAQILIIFAGVIWRYFLNAPLSWVDELAALLLVLIAFMGCYVALSDGKLARIELFIGHFKGTGRKALYVVSELITLVMLLFVVVYGAQLFLLPTSLNQKTPGLYIPLSIFYGLIPVMFTLCCLATVTRVLHYLFDKEDGEEC